MQFVDLAALTVHGVKNRLAILAARAEARGDRETLRDALEAAATLSRLLACYKAEKGQLAADIGACTPVDLVRAHRSTWSANWSLKFVSRLR